MGFGDDKFETLIQIKGCTKVRCGNIKEENGKKEVAIQRGASRWNGFYLQEALQTSSNKNEREETRKGWVALDNDTA